MKALIPLKLLLAIPVCAGKWVLIAAGYYANPKADNHDKDALRSAWWGFADPRLPPFGWSPHSWCDWLVEWCRLSDQRAAKLGGFGMILFGLVGFAIGRLA